MFGRKKEIVVYDPKKYGEVNERFIIGCKGDKDPIGEAQRRWMITVDWRGLERIDGLLQEAQPFFHDIKAQYPHYYHNRARNGNYVYYERPGLSHFRPTLKAKHITIPETLRHYLFVSEWLWSELDTRNEGKVVSVWDVTGVTASDLAGDTMRLMTATIKIMGQHYPERTDKLFIVNAPRWFTTMWRLISPMIDPNTKKKIQILGEDFHEELFKYVAPENVPAEFGGLDSTPLGGSREEKLLRRAADRANGGPGSSFAASLQAKGVFGVQPDPPPWQMGAEEVVAQAAATKKAAAAAESLAAEEPPAKSAAAAEVPPVRPAAAEVPPAGAVKAAEVPPAGAVVAAAAAEEAPAAVGVAATAVAFSASSALSPAVVEVYVERPPPVTHSELSGEKTANPMVVAVSAVVEDEEVVGGGGGGGPSVSALEPVVVQEVRNQEPAGHLPPSAAAISAGGSEVAPAVGETPAVQGAGVLPPAPPSAVSADPTGGTQQATPKDAPPPASVAGAPAFSAAKAPESS